MSKSRRESVHDSAIYRPGMLQKTANNKRESYTPFSDSMLGSPAWRALSARAKDLFFAARRQEANAKIHVERSKIAHQKGNPVNSQPEVYPLDKYDYTKDDFNGRFPFYLNEALLVRHKEGGKTGDWVEKLMGEERLYADAKNLKVDKRTLIEYGFLDEIPVGAGKRRNVKGVYLLSQRWRDMTREKIAEIKEGKRATKKSSQQVNFTGGEATTITGGQNTP